MDFSTYCISGLAVSIGYLVQTITGFAAGLVALPILLSVCDLPNAVALISVFNLTFSILKISRARSEIDLGIYRNLGIPTVIGVLSGAIILSYGTPDILRRAFGCFLLVYAIYHYKKKSPIQLSPIISYTLGALGGLLSGLFSSGGPAFAVYAISRYKTKEEIRANLIAILALTNVIRFFTLVLTGVLTWQTCIFALKLSPIFCIALLVGERLFFKMNVKVFLHVVMIFLVISGVNFVKPF